MAVPGFVFNPMMLAVEGTVIGFVTRLKPGERKSCEPVQRKARCEMHTFDSIITGARLRISTSSPSHT